MREEHGVFGKRSPRKFSNEYLQNAYSHIIPLKSTVIKQSGPWRTWSDRKRRQNKRSVQCILCHFFTYTVRGSDSTASNYSRHPVTGPVWPRGFQEV